MALFDGVLAPGWEWRGPSKVKKNRKHYIKVSGSNFTYVGPGGMRGDLTISCSGGLPHLKLAALTHFEDEIQHLVDERHREQRDALNSI